MSGARKEIHATWGKTADLYRPREEPLRAALMRGAAVTGHDHAVIWPPETCILATGVVIFLWLMF